MKKTQTTNQTSHLSKRQRTYTARISPFLKKEKNPTHNQIQTLIMVGI